MRKLIAALPFTAITSPAWGDDAISAVDLLLATCIPAMDDLANVDTMARNRGWVTLARLPLDFKPLVVSGSRWKTNAGFTVNTSLVNGLPSCNVRMPRLYAQIGRDEFFAEISAVQELKSFQERAYPKLFRIETYDIVGSKQLYLTISSNGGDIVQFATIFKANSR